MGLSITAYSRLKPVGRHTEEGEWCKNNDHVEAYTYASFPQSFRGIEVLSVVGGDVGEMCLIGGCYEITADTAKYAFSAGSYSGYNVWREDLQRQFNPTCDPDGPFYELIWFADNEGTIGPAAAADLLVDFRRHSDRYELPPVTTYPFPQDWRMTYNDFMCACELAADNGLIDFH